MQASTNFQLLFPFEIDWEKFNKYRPDVPFSGEVIEFLNALSNVLLKDPKSKLFPDVVTFAFFCRKANLLKQKVKYSISNELRLGRGILFHIAPSNVPINFGYSLVAGLLSGNANIVRISSKYFSQVDLIISHLHKLMESGKYNDVVSRITLVRYDHSSDANAYFSSIANVRLIWGGNATIAKLRENPIPVRSFDVCFADRYSIAAIDPKAIIDASDDAIKKLAESFYNDTYLFDQNACSAPHTVFWLKEPELELAKERFWNAVHKHVLLKYHLHSLTSVDKLTAFYRQAVDMDIKCALMPDNVIVRAEIGSDITANIDDFRCASGYFSEKTVSTLDEIAPIISIKYQTLGYYGFSHEKLKDFVLRNRFQGLDRVVPIGETTAFALTWDGYNLIETLSRISSIL